MSSQRGIFEFAERFLPELGYMKRAHMMNPMLPNLFGGKMSSSHPENTKIMFLDSPETVEQKIREGYQYQGDVKKNGVLAALRDILIPFSELCWRRGLDAQVSQGPDADGSPKPFCNRDDPTGTVFTVKVEEENGAKYKQYKSYYEIEQDLCEGRVSHDALIASIAAAFNTLLAPIRETYNKHEEWQNVSRQAYPESL